MKIEKNVDALGNYEYIFTRDNLSFKMYYGGNLDLYWEIQNTDVDMDNFEDYEERPLEFTISPEDTEIYSIFRELYDGVKCSAKELEEEEKRKEKAKMDEVDRLVYFKHEQPPKAHELVVRNGVVVWHSDEAEFNDANYVTITLINGEILLTFRKVIVENDVPGVIPIRFRNSGSKYAPFNVYFMKLFSSMEKVVVSEEPKNQHKRKLTNN